MSPRFARISFEIRCSPLAYSSFSITLLSKGDRFPPCGVPSVMSSYFPFIITPALKYLPYTLVLSPLRFSLRYVFVTTSLVRPMY